MSDEAKIEDTRTPMERAIAGGYKEPAEPSREERVAAAITAMEHAHKHNSSLGNHLVDEIKSLLSE